MMRIILEGGQSDTKREDLEADEPPACLERRGEQYYPVLDHYDQPMRDIAGRWRYRLSSPYRAMPRRVRSTPNQAVRVKI